MKISKELTVHTQQEWSMHEELLSLAKELLPKYGHNWHRHSLVTLGAASVSRILYYDHIYKNVLDVPGVICEFGVQWGAGMAQLLALRSIYEPFNRSRVIYGFDTFQGFVSLDEKDGKAVEVGAYSSTPGYVKTLDRLLSIHESFSPNPHIKKFELVPGDVSQTIGTWLEKNRHAIISMAIFDMDLYRPTKGVLEQIRPRLTKGSLLVFDELNAPEFPGETIALAEVLGLNGLRLRRLPYQPYSAWAVFGE
jgi:hypothetical protein